MDSLFYLQFPHHGQYSAYHRLAEFMPSDVRTVRGDFHLPRKWLSRLSLRQRAAITFVAEQYLHATTPAQNLIHHIYSEHTCLDRRNVTRLGPLVLTVHLPVKNLEQGYKTRRRHTLWEAAARAQAIVVVESGREDQYRNYFNNPNVYYVPHGIDTEYFRPRSEESGAGHSLKILTVGSVMRDYDTLINIAKECMRRGVSAQFTVLTNVSHRKHIASIADGLTNISMPFDLSDLELLELYQENDLLLLPLREATANNAILEASACGLPVCVSDFPSVRGYLPLDAGNHFFENGDIFSVVQFLEKSLIDRVELCRIGAKNRLFAKESLSWSSVAEQYKSVYQLASK